MCYMERITHREMRNHSAEILRRIADGESILVTNNGADVAVISPASPTELDRLTAQGRIRPARNSATALRSIVRKPADVTSAEILRDARGAW